MAAIRNAAADIEHVQELPCWLDVRGFLFIGAIGSVTFCRERRAPVFRTPATAPTDGSGLMHTSAGGRHLGFGVNVWHP